jgi:alkylation response protein AidB-like acyl-CoA dehydrogenase
MSYRDIDVGLTEEEIAMRDMVRRFGAEVVRPAGIELDKLPDPADVIADNSILWDVFKKFRELGLHKINLPKAIGGMAEDLTPMARYLISEELGYADAGLGISLGVASSPFVYCAVSDVPELKELAVQYVDDIDCKMIGCWAITEPDHGGDWSLGRNDPRCGPSLKGELKGDEYVINGQKSAWVSDGTIATHATVHVSLNPDLGMWGHGANPWTKSDKGPSTKERYSSTTCEFPRNTWSYPMSFKCTSKPGQAASP